MSKSMSTKWGSPSGMCVPTSRMAEPKTGRTKLEAPGTPKARGLKFHDHNPLGESPLAENNMPTEQLPVRRRKQMAGVS